MSAGPRQLVDYRELLEETLWDWQREYLWGGHRWVVVNKSRNTGYTWVALLHAVLHCAAHDGHTYFVATTKVEKAEDELIAPIKRKILPALRQTNLVEQLPTAEDEYTRKIKFPNNSEIKAASNDVDKLRGPTEASYLFDECASWDKKQHDAIEDSVFPIVRDQKLNPNGTLRMVSTPKPARTLYREIWERQDSDDKWSRQGVSIKEACDDPKFPHDDPDKFRRDCKNDKIFQQEYMRVFRDTEGDYFDRLELQQCPPCPEHVEDAETVRVIGVDVGRKNDLSAMAAIRYWSWDGKDHLHVDGVYLMEEVKFRVQKIVIAATIISENVRGACVDETAHPSMAEEVVEWSASSDSITEFFDLTDQDFTDAFGGTTAVDWLGELDCAFEGEAVKAVSGDRKRKADHTQGLQEHIENATLHVDPRYVYEWSCGGWVGVGGTDMENASSNPVVDDLAKVQRTTTAQGKVSFVAPRSDDGHADTYSAVELGQTAYEETKSRYLGSFG